MLKLEELKSILKASLPLKRYKHSIDVYETALELASIHKLDVQKVGIAALLHDCGREIPSRDSLAKAAELGMAKVFNMIILGAFLQVKPVVTEEFIEKGLQKSLPERHHKLIPENLKAVQTGKELVEAVQTL